MVFNMMPDDYFESILSPYSITPISKADLNFEIIKSDIAPIIPSNIQKRTIGQNKYYCNLDGNDTVFYFDTILNKVIALLTFSEDYSKITIKALNIYSPNVSSKYFIFNLVGYALHYIIQMKGGFVFHSSSICCQKQGIAFSAKSGTGKTTHTSLWLKYIPDCLMLNDDTPIIKLNDNGEVYIYGTPWAGTTGRHTNFSIPLKALVFIERNETNSIQSINSDIAIKRFYEGITPPLTPAMLSSSLYTMDRIISYVPTYLLSCNMQPEAAKVAYEAIFNG